jgi:hypothetical protein
VTLANLADEPYLGAGLGQGLGPLPPVGNRSFPRVTSEWALFLRRQGLRPTDVSASATPSAPLVFQVSSPLSDVS